MVMTMTLFLSFSYQAKLSPDAFQANSVTSLIIALINQRD